MDLFAGPGGWDVAARRLGIDVVGLENERDACLTRAAAGHLTVRADVTSYPAERFAGWDGVIASPPCSDWSAAGSHAHRDGKTGWMVDIVVDWVEAVRPVWIALEQVREALPVWQEQANLYREMGYSAWAGLLRSEQYGIPQTRTRAILLASKERPAVPPPITHQRYRYGEPAVEAHGMFGTVKPWVSMHQAIGWGPDKVVFQHRGAGMAERHGIRPARRWDEPSFAITGADRRTKFVVSGRPRQIGEPMERMTLEEALVIQGFPADYPVQGNQSSRHQQVGNAVPPPLAHAILTSLTGRP